MVTSLLCSRLCFTQDQGCRSSKQRLGTSGSTAHTALTSPSPAPAPPSRRCVVAGEASSCAQRATACRHTSARRRSGRLVAGGGGAACAAARAASSCAVMAGWR